MGKFPRKLAVATGLVLALALSGIAFAYWTTTGSGTGSGPAASSNGTITLHASFPTAGLYPGGSVPVTYKADNGGATDLQVGTVSAVVSTSDPTNCLASWFSVANAVENQVILHNTTGTALTNGSSLVFANDAADQDACKGATITLTLSS
jgi:hypothetical protein